MEEKKRKKIDEEAKDENLEDTHEKGSWLQVNIELFRYVIVSSTYPGQCIGQCTAVCHSYDKEEVSNYEYILGSNSLVMKCTKLALHLFILHE